jgi:hypothetical protein
LSAAKISLNFLDSGAGWLLLAVPPIKKKSTESNIGQNSQQMVLAAAATNFVQKIKH